MRPMVEQKKAIAIAAGRNTRAYRYLTGTRVSVGKGDGGSGEHEDLLEGAQEAALG